MISINRSGLGHTRRPDFFAPSQSHSQRIEIECRRAPGKPVPESMGVTAGHAVSVAARRHHAARTRVAMPHGAHRLPTIAGAPCACRRHAAKPPPALAGTARWLMAPGRTDSRASPCQRPACGTEALASLGRVAERLIAPVCKTGPSQVRRFESCRAHQCVSIVSASRHAGSAGAMGDWRSG